LLGAAALARSQDRLDRRPTTATGVGRAGAATRARPVLTSRWTTRARLYFPRSSPPAHRCL